jgi:Putative prokaryotic signal transducing protein
MLQGIGRILMGLANPVAVYTAAMNDEAHHLQTLLENAGIEAHVTEHLAVTGVSILGAQPEFLRPQVWVDRSQVEPARALLAEYEQNRRDVKRLESEAEPARETAIEVVCEECDEVNLFPPGLRGKVQNCRHCGAFVDVDDGEDSDSEDGEESEPTEG